MNKSELQAVLANLQAKIRPLEQLLAALQATLPPPLLYDSAQEHYGFRYGKPDIRHFCLLKGVRAVSALNACTDLALGGYVQEVYVLIRTIVECVWQIEFVAPIARDPTSRPEAARLIDEYFADFARNSPADFGKIRIRQRRIHEIIGADLDRFVENLEDAKPEMRTSAFVRYQSVYATLSNYVHARYPEVMDMYGGRPGRFHVDGMPVPPKYDEIIQQLDTYTATIALAFKVMVQNLDLYSLINSDISLRDWYESA